MLQKSHKAALLDLSTFAKRDRLLSTGFEQCDDLRRGRVAARESKNLSERHGRNFGRLSKVDGGSRAVSSRRRVKTLLSKLWGGSKPSLLVQRLNGSNRKDQRFAPCGGSRITARMSSFLFE